MANNPYVNKVQKADGTTLIDITDTTAVASDVAQGKYFYLATGEKVAGTSSGGGGSVVVVDTPDEHGGTIREITATNTVMLQGQKTVTLTESPQTITPDTGYDGFTSVVVNDPNNREDLCEQKDVDFIDFDGRLLYSYTAQEFLALTALPANPSYPGLVAQGWNWTLADAQSFVSDYGALVIGQNYITDDEKTRIYITIPNSWIQTRESKTSNMALYLNKTESSNAFTIDWGDGTTTPVTSSGTGAWNTTHKYQDSGDYIITIDVTVGSVRLGYWGSNQSLVSGEWAMGSCVNKVEIGSPPRATTSSRR